MIDKKYLWFKKHKKYSEIKKINTYLIVWRNMIIQYNNFYIAEKLAKEYKAELYLCPANISGKSTSWQLIEDYKKAV